LDRHEQETIAKTYTREVLVELHYDIVGEIQNCAHVECEYLLMPSSINQFANNIIIW
jgi:hypothetical protein